MQRRGCVTHNMEQNQIPSEEELIHGMNLASKRNILFIIAIIAVFTIFTLLKGGSPVRVTTDKETITVSSSKGSTTIPFSELDSVEYVPSPDYGSPAGGGTEQDIRYGTWNSPDLGEYEAYVHTGIASCIVLRSGSKCVAFNMENEETTRTFSAACEELLEKVKSGTDAPDSQE